MKQSKRLLSILLAMLMLFSVVSVSANAATYGLTKSAVAYDSIDGAKLTVNQVSTIICDLVDGLLADADIYMDVVVATINLRSLDEAFSSLYKTLGNVLLSKALVGDVDSIKANKKYLASGSTAYSRNGGANDLTMLIALVRFITSDNAPSTLSKLAYGIGKGSNQLGLGIVGNYVSVDALDDIPGMLKEPIFNALLYGSAAYPNKYKDTSGASSMSFDTLVNTALTNLLTEPQDKDSDGNYIADSTILDYEMGSFANIGSKADLKTYINSITNVNNNSLFQIVDNALQIAYDEFGTVVLNHDVKKVIMEATGVDFIRIKDTNVITAITANMPTTGVKNYLCNAAMWKYNGEWYFRDYVTEDVLDAEGNKTYDENGDVITAKVNRYFKADVSGANEFYDIVNWNYTFTPGDYNFAQGLTDYTSIVGELNHLLYFVLDKALNTSVKNDIMSVLGTNSFWIDGSTYSVLNENILNTAKYVLQLCPARIFGKDSQFANITYNDIADMGLEDLVAYIGISFIPDAMPQIILPTNFESGLQVEQVAAVVVREFLSDLTPSLAEFGFDARIFTSDSFTGSERKVITGQDQAYWKNVILDMGICLAATYLDNVTNIDLPIATLKTIYNESVNAQGWEKVLEEIVDWALAYVPNVIYGVTASSRGAVRGSYQGNAFDNLSFVLNKILPLGFIQGCSNNTSYAVDVRYLLENKIVGSVLDLDFENLLSILGRSTTSTNILKDMTLVKGVLTLVQQLLNSIIPAAVNSSIVTNSIDGLLSQAGLKVLIQNLLSGLNTAVYNGGSNGILHGDGTYGLLTVIAQFIGDWGGEQVLGTPTIGINQNVGLSNGALSGATFTIANGSKGVWRHGYMQDGTAYQDEQYRYVLTGITVKDVEGNAASGISITSGYTTNLAYGTTSTVTYNVSGVNAAGKVARIDVTYQVYNEDNALMADGEVFTVSKYVYFSYNGTNQATEQLCTDKRDVKPYVYGPYYINYEAGAGTIPGLNTYRLKNTNGTSSRTGSFPTISPTGAQKGITLNPHPSTSTSKSAGQSVDKDSSLYFQCFSVDEATYNAQTWTAGDTLTWNVTGYAFAGIGTGSDNGTKSIVLKFYNGTSLSNVQKVVDSETGKLRVSSDYKTVDCLASKVLTTVNDGETIRESNFAATTTNADGETVTVINGATAWANYVTAFNDAVRAARQPWNDNSVYTQQACYEALKVAAADLEYCKKTALELQTEGGVNNDVAVTALKASLANIQDNVIGANNYRDYMLYRWDRYTSWRSKANTVIDLMKAASYATPDAKFFPYTNISQTDLTAALATDANSAYILALLKDYTTDEMTAREKALTEVKGRYAGYSALDVSQISNMLGRTASRLLIREGDTTLKADYLTKEVSSAVAAIGTANNGRYSAESWARYATALATAQGLSNNSTRTQLFDAKYELQVARNELIAVEDGADYTELVNAIAYANTILNNLNLYDFTGKDKNLMVGKLMSNLGYEITNADGDTVELFPNAAAFRVDSIYDADHQYKIDEAAIALKNATKEFKLASAGAAAAPGVANGSDIIVGSGETAETIVEGQYAVIPELITPASVATYFPVSHAQATDIVYETADKANSIGTGKLVIAYGKVGNDTFVLATFTAIVMGDVNGDSVVDALDAAYADLAVNGFAAPSGAKFAACHGSTSAMTADIAIADFSAIQNAAVGLAAIV